MQGRGPELITVNHIKITSLQEKVLLRAPVFETDLFRREWTEKRQLDL